MSSTQVSMAVAVVCRGADRGAGKDSWELRPLALACPGLREHGAHCDCPGLQALLLSIKNKELLKTSHGPCSKTHLRKQPYISLQPSRPLYLKVAPVRGPPECHFSNPLLRSGK